MASSQRGAQEAVRGRGDSKCPYHLGQNVIYKCHDCNKLACINCATSMHRKHELDVISDIIPEAKRKIQDYVTFTEQKEIPRIKAAIKKGKDDRSLNQQYYKTLTSEIENQREILKFKLDEASNGLSKACRDMEQRSEDVFDKHETDLQAMIEELNVQNKDCKDALQSENDVLVFDILTFIPSECKGIPAIESNRLCNTTNQSEEQKKKWTKALETLKTLGVEFMENQERHLTLDHQNEDLGSNWFESSEEKLYRLRLDYTKLDTENRRRAAEYERELGLAKDTACQYEKQLEEISQEYVRLKDEKTKWSKKYTEEIDKLNIENEHFKKQANKETESKELLNKDKQIKKQNDDIARLKHESEQMKKIYKSRYTEKDNEVANLRSEYGKLYHEYSAQKQVIHHKQQHNEQLAELLQMNQNQYRLQEESYQAKVAEQKAKLIAAEEEKEKLLTRLMSDEFLYLDASQS